jgi:5-(carboxyamino)imidazole ribonucleotide synthase
MLASMTSVATGAPTVGIVGAGQLARMTYQASISLGVRVRLLAASAADSAAVVASDVAVGPPTGPAVDRFAEGCDVLTFDHELVDADQLACLEASGSAVRPSADVVALAQDKRRQRAQLGTLGFPIPPHAPVRDASDLVAFGAEHGWPIVAKARRGGYDGRGVWVLDGPEAATALVEHTAASGIELLVEAHVPIEQELAVLVARRPGGQAVVYPVVETVQQDGICRELLAPAPVAPELAAAARELGLGIAEAIGVVGVLAVELFRVGDRLVVNELAARPHNSGHSTIEGCATSQFENHLRAVLDWPLGATTPAAPAVATVNVLGSADGGDPVANLPAALEIEGAHVHLYGKAARPGRKLGHVTALGQDLDETRARARRAAALLVGRGAAVGIPT